jgi:hypothetical protein
VRRPAEDSIHVGRHGAAQHHSAEASILRAHVFHRQKPKVRQSRLERACLIKLTSGAGTTMVPSAKETLQMNQGARFDIWRLPRDQGCTRASEMQLANTTQLLPAKGRS